MGGEKLISVIVPVYNAEKYLARCVDSILAQTHSNLDIILVDDGSRDASGAICDAYAARDPRVRVIHKANAGVSAARNDGIDAARGEFIAFCDNDDFYAPAMLERLLGMCLDNDCAMAQCLCEKGTAEIIPTPEPKPVGVFTSRELLESFYRNASIYCWDKLYRREIFDRIRFPEGSYTDEDQAIVHHTILAAGRIAVTREQLYYHYIHPESVMNRGFDIRWATEAFDDRIELARRENLPRLCAETIVRAIYKEEFLLRMNRRYNRDIASRSHFRREHRTILERRYREAMRSAGVSLKEKLFVSACRFCPAVYHTYNYFKLRLVKGNKQVRWGEIK